MRLSKVLATLKDNVAISVAIRGEDKPYHYDCAGKVPLFIFKRKVIVTQPIDGSLISFIVE